MPGPASAMIRAAPSEAARPWPRHVLTPEGWRDLPAALAEEPSLAFQGLWADTTRVHALFQDEAYGAGEPPPLPLVVSAPVEAGLYAALSPVRPGAALFERALADLWGHQAAAEGVDARPWLDWGCWPQLRPLSARPAPNPAGKPESPEFLPMEAEASGLDAGAILHRIPLGPSRAGLGEPGLFHLTCAGETVVRLEMRMGYAHKGTLGLMRGKPVRAAAKLAARLSGDSTVAHGIAFARAVEAALDLPSPPPRALALRAVMAELERVANHLGDLGALCSIAGAALPSARFGYRRERLVRACGITFGHRLMMDLAVPGGVASDLTPGGAEELLRALDVLDREWPELLRACEEGGSLADRFAGTGRMHADVVSRVAPDGVVGRAAGRSVDARRRPGYAPYDQLAFTVPTNPGADVEARMRVRLAEVGESVSMLRALLPSLPEGPCSVAALASGSGEGMGVAESFRGACWHWVRLDAGHVAAAWARDPSWLHWPLLEDAMRGAEAVDVPLIIRSVNGSHSGSDL